MRLVRELDRVQLLKEEPLLSPKRPRHTTNVSDEEKKAEIVKQLLIPRTETTREERVKLIDEYFYCSSK